MTGKYSPTVYNAYHADQKWFEKYANGRIYDPEGFDKYGYNKDGVDRAGIEEYRYGEFEYGDDLYNDTMFEWGYFPEHTSPIRNKNGN